MIQSQLITGGSSKSRENTANQFFEKKFGANYHQFHPDLLILKGENSITIAQVRELKKWISLAPYQGKAKIAYIPEAHKLTIEAQNALLKLLEEPGSANSVILETNHPEQLLPTIKSRCQSINLKGEIPNINRSQTSNAAAFFDKIKEATIEERIFLAMEINPNKPKALDLVNEQILTLRSKMLAKPSFNLSRNISRGLLAIKHLEANVNPSLVVTNLFLAYN